MAPVLLALVPWLVLGVIGVFDLVTGRRLASLPVGLPVPWLIRAFGLIYCLAAAYGSAQVIEGSYRRTSIVILAYAVLCVGLVINLIRRRRLST
jgi:hypothetical protein